MFRWGGPESEGGVSLADGMAYRTAKYMSGTFIPVAGKLVSDTMDMFFCSADSLRSAMGLAGCIALFGCAFFHLLLRYFPVWLSELPVAVLGPLAAMRSAGL